MTDPIDALLEWFDLINEEHQAELARLVLTRMPNVDYAPEEDEVISDFQVWMRDEVEPGKVIGRVLMARSLIHYHLEERGNAQMWNFPMDMFLNVLNDDEETELTKNFARDKLLELPREKSEWMDTAASWKKLQRNALTDRILRDWERANLMQKTI